MNSRNCLIGTVLAGICISMTGCMSVSVGMGREAKVRSGGLVDGYVACNGIRPYDGEILEADLLGEGNERWGELASLDIWPIGGVGVSFIGARLKVLPFEAGFGIFGYSPSPERYPKKEKKECESPEPNAEETP